MTSQNSDCKRQKNLLQLPLPFYVSFILKWIVDDTIPPNNSDALSETLSQSLSESLSETMFQSLSGACLKPRFRIAPIRPFLKPPTFYPRSFWPTFKIPIDISATFSLCMLHLHIFTVLQSKGEPQICPPQDIAYIVKFSIVYDWQHWSMCRASHETKVDI